MKTIIHIDEQEACKLIQKALEAISARAKHYRVKAIVEYLQGYRPGESDSSSVRFEAEEIE